MFTLEKVFKFEAAHRLPHHDGKCARLHGHSWVGRMQVAGHSVNVSGPKTGMLVDYGDLGKVLDKLVVDHLDHYYLNDSLQMDSPTSEMIAWWLWNKLAPEAARLGVKLVGIVIEETCSSRCVYNDGQQVLC